MLPVARPASPVVVATLEPQHDLLGVRTMLAGDTLFMSGLTPGSSDTILGSALARWARPSAPPIVFARSPVSSLAATRHARLVHGTFGQ
eukprot:5566129-Alexandrium_andersonii.AAC.1